MVHIVSSTLKDLHLVFLFIFSLVLTIEITYILHLTTVRFDHSYFDYNSTHWPAALAEYVPQSCSNSCSVWTLPYKGTNSIFLCGCGWFLPCLFLIKDGCRNSLLRISFLKFIRYFLFYFNLWRDFKLVTSHHLVHLILPFLLLDFLPCLFYLVILIKSKLVSLNK